MDRKNFFKIVSVAGIAITAVGAISRDDKKNKIYVVNSKKCDGCKKCVKRCHNHAISIINEKAKINLDRCKHCGDCADICKHDAIINFGKSKV